MWRILKDELAYNKLLIFMMFAFCSQLLTLNGLILSVISLIIFIRGNRLWRHDGIIKKSKNPVEIL